MPPNMTKIIESLEEEFTRKFLDNYCDGESKVDPIFYEHQKFLRLSLTRTLQAAVEQREKELWDEYKLLENLHILELDAISCKTLEGFMLWSEERKATRADMKRRAEGMVIK